MILHSRTSRVAAKVWWVALPVGTIVGALVFLGNAPDVVMSAPSVTLGASARQPGEGASISTDSAVASVDASGAAPIDTPLAERHAARPAEIEPVMPEPISTLANVSRSSPAESAGGPVSPTHGLETLRHRLDTSGDGVDSIPAHQAHIRGMDVRPADPTAMVIAPAQGSPMTMAERPSTGPIQFVPGAAEPIPVPIRIVDSTMASIGSEP